MSTLEIRKIIGKRFNLPPHMIRVDDIKTLMSYFTLHDLKDLTEEGMGIFIAEGKANGTFFGGRR
jgi:hypothetical protein